MNPTTGPFWLRRAVSAIEVVTATTVVVALKALRLPLFAVLGLLEPIVRWVLSVLGLGGFAVCALYAFAGPPGHKAPYGTLLLFSTGCAVLLVLYQQLLRLLRP